MSYMYYLFQMKDDIYILEILCVLCLRALSYFTLNLLGLD